MTKVYVPAEANLFAFGMTVFRVTEADRSGYLNSLQIYEAASKEFAAQNEDEAKWFKLFVEAWIVVEERLEDEDIGITKRAALRSCLSLLREQGFR